MRFELRLWLRIAWPSGAEEKLAQLPRRFRQVLFLDPFGDVFWDPNQALGPWPEGFVFRRLSSNVQKMKEEIMFCALPDNSCIGAATLRRPACPCLKP